MTNPVDTDGTPLVAAKCQRCRTLAVVWSGNLWVRPGETATWGNAPMICKCGGRYSG